MSPTALYRKYIKNNMFAKMLLWISAIAVVTIVTLSYLMYYFLFQSAVRSELDVQRGTVERVERYVNQKFENVQFYVNDLYRNSSLGIDTSYFLMNSINEYMAKRMNRIVGSGHSTTDSVLAYFKQKLDDDADIENIMLYSAEQQYVYVYKQGSMTRLYQANATHSYIPDVMAMGSQSVTLPNFWLRKLAGDADIPLFSIRTPINDMSTYKNLGQLLVLFKTEPIADLLSAGEEDSMKGSVMLLSGDGSVMYDSAGRYYDQKYPYAERLLSSKETVLLEEESYVTTTAHNQAGYMVVGITPKRDIVDSFQGIRNTIIIVALLCIIIAVSIPALLIVNYSRRTDNIIRFMRKVEKGEFVARMQDTKEDQLGQIAGSFNEMLNELTRYIDKVYKAEINQKNAELSALQARINPHFLYNTLEVIRMRALSQGAQDVGDMIYSLSMLFKNIVQHKSNYTLKDELEACRLYLELFRIRYKDKYLYKMHCDDSLRDVPMIKMSLQPLIENYIVHGLRSEEDDNWLTIEAVERHDEVVIAVNDNGKGMTPERLAHIQARLERVEDGGESFGLRSVHERLKLSYGQLAGMDIKSRPGGGTCVTIRFPITERGQQRDV
ncbi:sensor histidine kinase [Paenibacillus sp. JCM 10914]|uniref:cache domain-containing sensor histidine kinase n=1 Tax=Paenibacillus sp. JCM 10914 TaxID=1236974 RepID=UPI0003CCAE57|nr:histidine kinase [Paenibacillus sp. JCM 10914]GAE04316.1 two-component sensor kinase yesM, associated with MetSO reductase [Paenibacillus sp. JCM 10914]